MGRNVVGRNEWSPENSIDEQGRKIPMTTWKEGDKKEAKIPSHIYVWQKRKHPMITREEKKNTYTGKNRKEKRRMMKIW
jgi:hypothetical protein